MIYRVIGRDIPVVGISKEVLKHGAVLSVGGGEKDPIVVRKADLLKMKLSVPEKAVDFGK
jgi:hypothetical protein